MAVVAYALYCVYIKKKFKKKVKIWLKKRRKNLASIVEDINQEFIISKSMEAHMSEYGFYIILRPIGLNDGNNYDSIMTGAIDTPLIMSTISHVQRQPIDM